MFDTMVDMSPGTAKQPERFRWKLAEEDAAQGTLFADEQVVDRRMGVGEYRGLEFLHVNAKKIINHVPAESRMPFRHTINAYRGCSHACVYCFARPTHEYLGLNIGEEFERKIVVKINAVTRVRAEVRAPSWAGEPIAMGTNTDPYQRAEGRYQLTRGVIEQLGEVRNPFSILTKSTLILRDLDVLTAAATRTDVHCNFSIGTLDDAVWKSTEPGTPHPRRRVEAVRRLNDAGIPTGVLVAPIIPGMSDHPDQLEEVIAACTDAGATSISAIALHLRAGVKEHFFEVMQAKDSALCRRLRTKYRGSYLAHSEQQAITDRVKVAIGQRRQGRSLPAGDQEPLTQTYTAQGFVTGHEPRSID